MWPRPTAEFRSRWEEEYKLSKQQFAEAGVQVEEV
jgi:hypothetical protein